MPDEILNTVRRIHFSAEGYGVCIVYKTEHEPGALELTASFVSDYPARYNLVNGEIVDAYAGKTDEEVFAILEAQEQANAEALAAARFQRELNARAAMREITKADYLNRFTREELSAMLAAAQTDMDIQVVRLILDNATSVDLDDPRTVGALQLLETRGILAVGRADQVRMLTESTPHG